MSTELIIKFAPWVIGIMSLAGMLVIIFRKIPVVLKLPANAPEGQAPVFFLKVMWQKIILRLKGMRYSSYQPALLSWLEKSLRRLRLLILKIDALFVRLISALREKSQIWTVRSRAWMEQYRLKKIQKLQILEKLDRAEILETIEKARVDSIRLDGEEDVKKNPKPFVAREKELIDQIAKDPRDIEAYKKLGLFYCSQKNKEDAKNCFKQVLKLNPDDLEVIGKMREISE